MLWIGISGFQYPEWRGNLYPEKLPVSKMLPHYAEHFSTTEINYTFRRLPTVSILEHWVVSTPLEFKFSLKALQEFTHFRRLRKCENLVPQFCQVIQSLNSKLGVVLFQLPSNFRKDTSVLADFLHLLPPGIRAAFEFRHASWHDDDVWSLLKSKNVALCIAGENRRSSRSRKETSEVFVYFKHEEEGTGIQFARHLRSLFSECIPHP